MFKKMFKVNNRQMGENSPNLVTLSGNRLNRLSSMAASSGSCKNTTRLTAIQRHILAVLLNYIKLLIFWVQQSLVPLLLLGPPFFPIILFGYKTLLTGMTGISLHMQWPLTSQSHGSLLAIILLICSTEKTPEKAVHPMYGRNNCEFKVLLCALDGSVA
jgi:hypothetical protein